LKLIDKKGGLSMQEAIRNYIEEERKKEVPFEKIEEEIDKVSKSEIQSARKKQYREWRKINK